MEPKNFMKKSKKPAREPAAVELEFPDWSGMDDSTARISPETAFEYCERYAQLFPELVRKVREGRPAKCLVEFVLF